MIKISTFRLRAFLVHLLPSICIAAISLWVVFVIWHPAPLAKAVGVTHIFIMMLVIDAVLGPLLTFIVSKQGKKSLKFDLGVIVVLQLAAFIYGMYNIAISRPVYIAFDTSRFEVVQANNIPKESLGKAVVPYQTLDWGRPEFVAVTLTDNIEQKNERLFLELETGIAPSMQPNLYEPLVNQSSILNNRAKGLSDLYEHNPKLIVNTIKQQHPEATQWLPLKAYVQDMVVLVNKKGAIVDIVDLRPW